MSIEFDLQLYYNIDSEGAVFIMNNNVQRIVKKQKYRLHQETKQERLEDFKNKLEQYDITSVFKCGTICNSVFGKKKILSRKRINQIIISKQDENRL